MNSVRRLIDYLFVIYQDDSAGEKSRKLALRATMLFWLVFTSGMFFIKGKPKEPEITEIKISLSPVEEKIPEVVPAKTEMAKQESAKSAKASVPEKVEKVEAPQTQAAVAQTPKPVEAKPSLPVAQKPEPAEAPAKAPVKKPEPRKYTISKPQNLAKSNEQLMAEQMAAAKKNQDWNENAFDSGANTVSSKTEPSSNAPLQQINGAEAVRGTAAEASSQAEASQASAVATTARSGSGAAEASGGVKNTLQTIGDVKPALYSGTGNGIATTAVVNSSGSSGSGISIAMSDGRVRRLLSPSEPVINISEENAKLITTNVNLKIRFTVLKEGNVMLSGIYLPSSTLPQEVQKEIKEQIAKWRFAQDPSESTAVFDFSIIKK